MKRRYLPAVVFGGDAEEVLGPWLEVLLGEGDREARVPGLGI